MIPLRDNNPTHTTPVVTIGLIVVNVLVFLGVSLGPDRGERVIWRYGFLPAGLLHEPAEIRQALITQARQQPPQLAVDRYGRLHAVRSRSHADNAVARPASLKLLTCMFLHGGWMHLIGNMLYLWIFGNNIEDRLGPGLFIVFYLATGVIGTLAHTLIDPGGLVPLVGASGAISGILGAYILLFPRARVEALIPIGWYLTTVLVPAWVFLGVYALLQLVSGLPALGHAHGSGVAYWAHIGGFAAGLASIKFLPQRRYARPIRPRPLRSAYDDDDAW